MKINLEIINSSFLIAKENIEALNTKELVPKMIFRRRFTKATKLVVELMNNVNFTTGRIIYSSAYGELNSTANILNAISSDNMISPTDFQNSVYNTPVSYASILHNNKNEIMTISSGEDSADKLLKIGAIKALDKDEILLIATETLNIDKINEVNKNVDYLEAAVALKVKVTEEKANIKIDEEKIKLPRSINKLIYIAKKFKTDKKNIIEIEI